MPGNLSTADTSFPDLNGARDDKEKIEKITAYLALLLEQLRYTLNNLGMDNFNDTELKIMSQTLTEPVEIKLRDIEGNVTTIQLAADELSSTVEDLEGDVSTLRQTADSITAEFGQNGRVTQLQQSINGLQIKAITNSNVHAGSSLSDTALYFYDGYLDRVPQNYGLGYDPELGHVIGRVCMDSEGQGTEENQTNRMFVGTGRGRAWGGWAEVDYALKLQSAGNSSYSTLKGGIWIKPDGKDDDTNERYIAQIYDNGSSSSGQWYKFKSAGLYHGTAKIGHTEASIKGWIRDAVNVLATKNGLSPITLSGTTFS